MPSTPDNTAQKQALFLGAYKTSWGNVSKACAAADVGRSTYYDWCKDSTFLERLEETKEAAKDLAQELVLTVAQGYTLPEVKVFMVPVVTTTIVKGKPVRVETREPRLVPIKKHVGPDYKAAAKYLESQARERGWGKEVEVKHTGSLDIKTIVLKEVQPTHGIKPPTDAAQLATDTEPST